MSLPTLNAACYLVPQCAPDLCVTVNAAIKLIDHFNPPPIVLGPLSDRSARQRWLVTAGSNGSSMFSATFPADEYDDPATITLSLQEGGFTNVIAGFYPNADLAKDLAGSWNLIPYGDYFAMQNVANTDQNLNVAGDGPYAAGGLVLTWDWSGGAPNELWKFVEA